MARPRQKKKLRSSKPKVQTGTAGRTKAGKKKINILGNETIARHWDRKLTLVQNYQKLGLSVRLNAPSGGTEHKRVKDTLDIGGGGKESTFVPEEVEVDLDPETGKIVRVREAESTSQTKPNPLNDSLNEITDVDPEERVAPIHSSSEVVRLLEAQAAAENAAIEETKRPRKQSEREEEWLRRLVNAHGSDTAAMCRDRKLNPMQQSEGDIKRRLKKWRQKHG